MTYAKSLIIVFTLICSAGTLAFSQQNQLFQSPFNLFENDAFNLFSPKIKQFKTQNSATKTEIPERVVYEQLFRLLIRFEEQAVKQQNLGNSRGARFFRDFFERKVRLNPQQAAFLKTITKEFSDETKRLEAQAKQIIAAKIKNKKDPTFDLKLEALKQQRMQMPLLYRQRIERFFGVTEFEKFAVFVREKIASKMFHIAGAKSFAAVAESFGGYGMSEVFYDNGDVYGYSSTSGYGYSSQTASAFWGYCDPEEGEQCPYTSVVATLSSQTEGAIATEQDGQCGDSAQVDFYISGTNFSDLYCINGEHSYEEHDPYCAGWNPITKKFGQAELSSVSEDCVDTPQLNVTGVGFQLIATDSPPIDDNPNAESGLRIFPDDNTPGDTTNRQRIRVTATLSERIAGETIYFRNFDLDDPSTDTTIDPNGNAGNDNNGRVGTSGAGQLSSTSAVTNSMGVASVEFTVTMQPGDNFAIAASRNQNYVNGITVNGTELRNGGTLIDTTCADTDSACRTEMLTVWRRLHIEVDSMGASDGNFVLGTIPTARTILAGGQATITVNPSPAQQLEVNRFIGGRLSVGNSLEVMSNTTDTVTVRNNTRRTIYISANTQFQLYDDDDFDDDGTALNGDTGENISTPAVTEYLESSDDRNANVFADAYARPVYDIGDNNDNTQFVANLLNNETNYMRILFDFDLNTYEANAEFWTIYLLGAYQDIIEDDGDPHELETGNPNDAPSYGIIDNVYPNAQGAFVFLEVSRPREYPSGYASRPVSRAATAGHEIGHLFGGEHDDEGLMTPTRDRTEKWFRPITLRRIRTAPNP